MFSVALFLARLCVCRVLVVGTGSTERGASLALTPCGGDTIWRFALSVADQVLLLQRDLQMYKELQSETTANILDARLQLSQFSEQAEVLEGQVVALTNMAAALAQVVSRLNSSDTGSSDAGSAVIAGGSGGTTMSAVSAASAALAAVSEGVSRVSNGADTNGTLLARFGSEGRGDGQLDWPSGLRLLSDGSGVVVADRGNCRLCLFTMSGAFVRAIPVRHSPLDVVECDDGSSFVVVFEDSLMKVSAVSDTVVPFGSKGDEVGQFNSAVAMALVPPSADVDRLLLASVDTDPATSGTSSSLLVVRDEMRVQVFRV